ncbi:MAG: xanthine dehydrogenase family protein molybdopterin-binding subunit [Elusimicrobiota bacterium]
MPRKEGPAKLCGLAQYVDDYALPGCLYGATLRSGIAFGAIKSIVFDPAFPWSECVVVTAKDIPGKNCVALIEDDQPLLAEGVVRHPMEPILLVGHASRAKAYEAIKHIRVEYEAAEPVLSIEDSLALKGVLRSPDNSFKNILISKGDIRDGFEAAEIVVEGEYRVPHQEHAYIENNAVLSYFDGKGTLVVVGSIQCPYYVRKSLSKAFGLPPEEVRVVQAATGGGFGGKEDFPSMLAGHCALLTWKSRRPVKLVYDRQEDMEATTKRHPARIRHKTGLTRHGKLLAQDIEVVMDAGAYMTLSPVVLSRGAIHAAGPYDCPNVRIIAKAAATHTPPNGAFRGFGAPQTLYAAELQMERIARKMDIDGLTLRRLNVIKEGGSTATGQVLRVSVGASEVLERAAAKSHYVRKRIEYARHNRDPKKRVWKGIGLSLCHHGSGFTGSGEVFLASRAGVALTREGGLTVLAASTEIGQGTNTLLAQIAADALGVPYERVEVENPDTSKVPDSGPTVASRTCMIVGKLIERSAKALRADLERAGCPFPADPKALLRAAQRLCGAAPRKDYISQYEKPEEIQWDDASYRGDAYGAFAYEAMAVDLEVDKVSFEVRLREITAAVELGKAVNPLLAEGQIIGGTAQALGYALFERPHFKDGFMRNAQLTNYILPTSADTPRMKIELLEKPYTHGPFGAKGIGELPMDAPAPAVAAAVLNATGAMVCHLPILPEDIMDAR